MVEDAGVRSVERGDGGLRVGQRVEGEMRGWPVGLGFGRHVWLDEAYWLILIVTPDFCVNEAEEALVAGDAGEACLREGKLRIGEGLDAEVGEDAEGEVEGSDVEAGDWG